MRAVQRTSELERIAQLPRRNATEHADLADALTQFLTRPHECHDKCAVLQGRPVHTLQVDQAIALADAHDNRGLIWQAPVGAGKTLVSLLLPTLFGAKRPLLIIPALARGETLRKIRVLREHWNIVTPTIITFEFLSTHRAADLLERLDPDLIVIDEAHWAKDPRGPRAKRISRCRKRRPSKDELIVCAMSGTTIDRGIRDCAHIAAWAMVDLCPLPVHDSDAIDWGLALDEKVHDKDRIGPGALTVFVAPGESPHDLQAVRRGVARRVFDTPGAVRSASAGAVAASLYVEGIDLALSREEDEAYQAMREEWITPDGHPIADAVALWRHARELALGFTYKWVPRPPNDWLAARAAWCATVRDILKNNRRELDTEFQVAEEVREFKARKKSHPAEMAYDDWQAIKDTFVPNTVPHWVGTTALEYCKKWIAKRDAVIWVEHRAFGERLAAETGLPYFTKGGYDDRGRHIEHYQGPCISSIASNHIMRNLQQWDECLVTSCVPKGKIWEQLIGRHHRQGQKSDAVRVSLLLSCREQVAGFAQACADAELHKAWGGEEGSEPGAGPKLTVANINLPDTSQHNGWAWREQRR